ncbi:MAG TPA: hypothetical protein VL992_17175 [Tepidisphaeraceae bacterium]|nr:hypothetical protein [Tepidisphaeraceae bacterium]
MKLPNGDQAIIEAEKILDYLLDPLHRYGRHHAELFRRLLGIDRSNWQILDDALRNAARYGQANVGSTSTYGTKYEIRFEMTGPKGSYTILSVWMIRSGESQPRLVTAYLE